MPRSEPLFSVIIPTYNRGATVASAITSVLAQDIESLEVIVVDDGSTDDTVDRLAEIKDDRLLVIRQANAGASAARNNGIDHASGTYVAFLDSDDHFLPGHLSSLLMLLRADSNVAAYSPIVADRGEGCQIVKPYRAIGTDETMAHYLMCDRGFVQTSGLALPNELAKRVRYRVDVSYGDDTDFAIRLQLAGAVFRMTPEPSVVWMDRAKPDRLSHLRKTAPSTLWLDDLRPHIPSAAYYGYRGWHVAKAIAFEHPFQAARYYVAALLHGCYRPGLAARIFCQVFLPQRVYRALADWWITLPWIRKRHAVEPTILPSGGLDIGRPVEL